MNLILGLDRPAPWSECTVAIGHFDGVHRGHQAVISAAVEDAWRNGRPSVVLTFDRNPAEVVRPESAPPYLCTLAQRLERFDAAGADHTVVCRFDAAFAAQPWLEFAEHALRETLHCKHLVIGHDFRFGHGREGSADTLASRKDDLGLEVTSVPPLTEDGRRVSSTDIRRAVARGDIASAARWLGHRYALVGTVVRGDATGRQLGYPTVNLAPSARVAVPGDGVYAGWATVYGQTWRTAISVGTRPTVGSSDLAIEGFLLDYEGGDLYGRTVTLTFAERLRGQETFPTLDALRERIAADVAECRAALSVAP
jgi:riboflavin kinase/FMN adenylyltransferase